LDHHAVFNRRISFSKGSDGTTAIPGFIRWSHEIRATSCILLFRSLPLGETHAQAAVRAVGGV
jgi:hypothetical protein